MTPVFRKPPVTRPASQSPERLFDDLPRTRDGVASLWSHQADVLRAYFEAHVDSQDISLELPTGSGKTLPALLIGEWRRSALGARVAFACPTVQLARQVHAEAIRQGIDSVALFGSHHRWESSDLAKYEGARSIAITTYSTLFNINPALSEPQTLIFDDAHAGEQFVSSAWSISVSRARDRALYNSLLAVIGSTISALHLQRLEADDPDPITRGDVKLLPLRTTKDLATSIDCVLSEAQGDLFFRYSMLRQHLDRCLIYFGWDGFLIRPYIVPTGEHPHFANASQRIYVSATLGDGGELERAFGRAPIERLPVPAGWDQRTSGRQFFVFPELVRDEDAHTIAQSIIQSTGKALVITPSDQSLLVARRELTPDGMDLFGKGDIEETLDGFRHAKKGILFLANRYDGLDLADESCRLTVLDGLPVGEHLQERFLTQSLRAGRVLDERLRTRVIQGAGRCTRGLKDFSVVVVLGVELTRFLQRLEIRSALRADTQAELMFGITASEVSGLEMLRGVASCLAQDDAWQNEAEPYIAEYRREARRELPVGTSSLAGCVGAEVAAWSCLWRSQYLLASQHAVEVAQLITEEPLRQYRALWLYFAAAWQESAAIQNNDRDLMAGSNELLKKAHAASRGTTWLRDTQPLPKSETAADPLDEISVTRIQQSLNRRMSGSKWSLLTTSMLDGLSGTDSLEFEIALSHLGDLLGAEAFRPKGKGRADSVWLFGKLLWLTFEAKSETSPDRLVSMDDVRQANTHLASLAADQNSAAPSGSASLIVTPKRLVDSDAVTIAEGHLFLATPTEILAVARDTLSAWAVIRTSATNLEGSEAATIVRETLHDYQVQATNIKERLFGQPIRG